ncbi:nicotinate-nucleotide adenylyltransferase [Paraflavitalea soli]|uniref:Nicotinate-nucleotide adenylyltransferase n=1 Tax=Paraflavitalea soli TaxID=2315862 RepID=A0A3B7MIE7_9BACT|nr:nicotinate-nucleotide adenylyltransferase [Paraflavitalea soli]AXY74182.1 nicotinate-nucleotide adenylyltransferase [Paraflavitalea soli]
MKSMKLLTLLGILVSGITTDTFAQIDTLPAVTVLARNYKYLRSVNNKEAAPPVKVLQNRVASFDVKNSEYYEDDYDNYFVSFYLPQGYVLAVYDSSGTLLRTAERFRNVAIPPVVNRAVVQRFPNWGISNDVYRISYEKDGGQQMMYKLLLMNGSKRMRVKINEKGEFMD